MRKEKIFTLKNCYRDDMDVYGFHFGKGEKSACIVGAMRGNEVQQLYICSQLVKALKELEEKGAIVHDNEILVIPSVNHSSMNIGKRFWATDNTDINRMFPGYSEGETTQRIAGGVFEAIQGYSYGIQFLYSGRFCSPYSHDGDRISESEPCKPFWSSLCCDPQAEADRHGNAQLQLADLEHECVLRLHECDGLHR